MRALVVTNMRSTPDNPARGSFVRDQVAALRAIHGVEVELFDFEPGWRGLVSATRALRRRYEGVQFDVVHSHFGLSAWPALAVRARARVLTLHGTDVRHPRTRRLTRAAMATQTLTAAVSAQLAAVAPGAGKRRRIAVLPCGVDVERCRPIARNQARAALGLDPAGPYLLFPADPRRAGKRHDLALDAAGDVPLLTLGRVAPEHVPLWINAANAVLVPSDEEGFGLAVLEALACDVPVLATRVGVHPLALQGLPGTLCAPYARAAWQAALAPHLQASDPRIAGRARATLFSSRQMAERVAVAWRALTPERGADAAAPALA